MDDKFLVMHPEMTIANVALLLQAHAGRILKFTNVICGADSGVSFAVSLIIAAGCQELVNI
jgi:hypothetical protein